MGDGETHQSPFTSAHRQRLVLSRMKRIAGIDLYARMDLPSREQCLDRVQDAIKGKDEVRANELFELLTTTGSFRPHVEHTLGAQIKLLTQQVLTDKSFVVFPDGKNLSPEEEGMLEAQDEHMEAKGLPGVTMSHIKMCVNQLEAWIEGKGKDESFHGSLKQFWPLHQQAELAFFKTWWGSLHLACQLYITGKNNESETSMSYHEETQGKHLSPFWVPLDAIRDYFGDHVGLYSAWLGLYTGKLITPGIVGVGCMVGQGFLNGVDNNWMTVPYSVYLALWSVLFLTLWQRKENELSFLWGTEDVESSEQPRSEFEGILLVNQETHQEMLVHPSQQVRGCRRFTSTWMSIGLICCTALAAFFASYLKFAYNPPKSCQFVPLRATDPVCSQWVCAEGDAGWGRSCVETAPPAATSDPTDKAACAAITGSELMSSTACDAVMTNADSSVPACSYTAARGSLSPYAGFGGFLDPTDYPGEFERVPLSKPELTSLSHGTDYWFCQEYAFGCTVGSSCAALGCEDISATCDDVDVDWTEAECWASSGTCADGSGAVLTLPDTDLTTDTDTAPTEANCLLAGTKAECGPTASWSEDKTDEDPTMTEEQCQSKAGTCALAAATRAACEAVSGGTFTSTNTYVSATCGGAPATCTPKTSQANSPSTCTMGVSASCVSSTGANAAEKASNGAGDCDYTAASNGLETTATAQQCEASFSGATYIAATCGGAAATGTQTECEDTVGTCAMTEAACVAESGTFTTTQSFIVGVPGVFTKTAAYVPATLSNTMVDNAGEAVTDELECWRIKQTFDKAGVNGTVDFLLQWPETATTWERMRWGFASSFCNLLVIQIFGRIYEGVARSLNDWENHRTQTEYDDQLILKNFMFQVKLHVTSLS